MTNSTPITLPLSTIALPTEVKFKETAYKFFDAALLAIITKFRFTEGGPMGSTYQLLMLPAPPPPPHIIHNAMLLMFILLALCTLGAEPALSHGIGILNEVVVPKFSRRFTNSLLFDTSVKKRNCSCMEQKKKKTSSASLPICYKGL